MQRTGMDTVARSAELEKEINSEAVAAQVCHRVIFSSGTVVVWHRDLSDQTSNLPQSAVTVCHSHRA